MTLKQKIKEIEANVVSPEDMLCFDCVEIGSGLEMAVHKQVIKENVAGSSSLPSSSTSIAMKIFKDRLELSLSDSKQEVVINLERVTKTQLLLDENKMYKLHLGLGDELVDLISAEKVKALAVYKVLHSFISRVAQQTAEKAKKQKKKKGESDFQIKPTISQLQKQKSNPLRAPEEPGSSNGAKNSSSSGQVRSSSPLTIVTRAVSPSPMSARSSSTTPKKARSNGGTPSRERSASPSVSGNYKRPTSASQAKVTSRAALTSLAPSPNVSSGPKASSSQKTNSFSQATAAAPIVPEKDKNVVKILRPKSAQQKQEETKQE